MNRILVTGGAGYIGGTAVKMLLAAGFEVTILDDCSTGHEDSIDSRATVVLGSVLEKNAVLTALNGCDAVIHFAAKSLVGESVEKPDLYMHVNVDGTKLLLECMKELGVKKIVFSSTAATYGDPKEERLTENSPTHPTNPYGLSKLKVEELLTTKAHEDGFAAISLRYFNVAGALKTQSGWHAERHNPETHLIPNVLKATPENPLKLFGTDWPTPDHTCIRDYIHVVDLIEAHIAALNNLETGTHQIINLGSGDGYSVKQVIDTAGKVTGREIPVIEVERRAGDPAILVAAISKAESQLGWRPTRNLTTMIEDTYNAFK